MGTTAQDGSTVGAVASRAGVTVRTLHHWDAVGLVTPSVRTPGGYRLYDAADLARIQRVLAYRELGLSLDAIRELLDAPAGDPTEPLREQQKQLRARIGRLRSMAESLDRMIEAHEHGILLTAEQQAAIFGPDWRPEWVAGARERWGDTTQWAQYAERAAHRSPADWKTIADTSAAIDADLAAAMRAGSESGSAQANQLAERHRAAFSAYFPITHEMHVCLGRM